MLDRGSTFAHPRIIDLLKTRFVPVAIDQAYQRRQQDTEGDFYRKIAGQGPRNDFRSTTQGFYVATAGGDLLLYNNNRDPQKLRRLIQGALDQFERGSEFLDTAPIEIASVDPSTVSIDDLLDRLLVEESGQARVHPATLAQAVVRPSKARRSSRNRDGTVIR